MMLPTFLRILSRPSVPQLISSSLIFPSARSNFHSSSVASGGRLSKIPWRLSETRKANLKKRLREVDSVIQAVKDSGVKCHALTNAMELPTEAAMTPKDKFFVFSARSKGYRKGIHKVPHFTKITSRVNPKGF
ncbi:hypothetical protein Pst134EA_013728 [Puccinia striiformis f. sp. tritici]|uniref:hypothetical protein n=1 Tax=Puccinia striiformis f. sp. tritici TaxID=168172 RepID=UPI000A129EA5|nr:hypothetical protein Pst134EA_013728 [Puccinia striiformis f. sp. tritici]KAH9465867.1 hypothetical protein Pst134EA_013728 [Puccinia striiformis f. sp. tritici]KAI9604111.1 hypothetical protein H4Q26_003723 [Puccinia striiformis f. sp. tritici PST-130]